MSDSIDVDVSDLPNVTADVIFDPAGGLEATGAGCRIKSEVFDQMLPAGGTAGQILTKGSGTDYDADWQDPDTELPTGGTTGQVLAKASNSDFDVEWITPSAGGGGGRSGGYDLVPGGNGLSISNTTTEVCIAGLKVGANLAGNNTTNGIWGIKIHITGTMKGGGTLATFTPRIRWGTSQSDITGTVILATPTIVAGNNTTNAAFEMDVFVLFTNLNITTNQFAEGSIVISEHTSNAGGALVVNQNNTKVSPVSIGNVTTDKYLNVTMQMSVTGTAAFYIIGATYEMINFSSAV